MQNSPHSSRGLDHLSHDSAAKEYFSFIAHPKDVSYAGKRLQVFFKCYKIQSCKQSEIASLKEMGQCPEAIPACA